MAFYRRQTTDAEPGEGPHVGQVERERADWSTARILAVFALFIAFGLWFYFHDKEMVSGDGTVQKIDSHPVVIPDSNENRPSPPRAPAPAPKQ